jgi:hypothetical protein
VAGWVSSGRARGKRAPLDRRRASAGKRQPDERAFGFLADGETAEVTLMLAELDRQARAIAAMPRPKLVSSPSGPS